MEFNSTIRGLGESIAGNSVANDLNSNRADQPAQSTTIRGIVLAGGPSYGDCELEQIMPRPMLPVATRPLICHILSWFGNDGVGRATVCANGNTALFSHHLRNGEGLNISIDYTEDLMPRGPAGCAHDAAKKGDEELFVVVEGGVVPQVDLGVLLDHHRTSGASMTMVVHGNEFSPDQRLEDEELLGIYVFSRKSLSYVSGHGFCDIKEGLISDLYKRGESVSVLPVPTDVAPRIKCLASYLTVNSWAVQKLSKYKGEFEGHVRHGDAWIHRSAQVDDSAKLIGPIWVGPGALIGQGAMIVGPVSVGAGCEVAANAVVTRSAIWDRGMVGDGAIVDDSIVSNGARANNHEVYRRTICKLNSKNRGGILGWFGNRRR